MSPVNCTDESEEVGNHLLTVESPGSSHDHPPHNHPNVSLDQCRDENMIDQRLGAKRSNSHYYSRSPARCSLVSHRTSVTDDDGHDKIDYMPEEMKFNWIDILGILFSIGSFLFDIGTDIAVATIHYRSGDFWYFGLTITFILIPTFVMTGISLRWYVLDAQEIGSPPVSTRQWTLRIFFLLLQIGPILRYIDSLKYGIKFLRNSNDKLEQKKYYHFMVYEDTDATLLRLFECFMEAAPQLVLQIYILAVKPSESADNPLMVLTQIAACIASLVSLSWSLVSYQRSLRLSLPNKAPLSWQGIAVQFLWRLFVIAARVLALALFAAVYNWYISIVCGIHCFIMFLWIVSMKTTFCAFSTNKFEELGYDAILAVMFIFCYFNPVDSPTRYRYTIFYLFMFSENTLLMVLWYIKAPEDIWYRYPAIIGHYLSFFTGLLFMISYYLLLHPSGDIKVFRNRGNDRGDESNHEARTCKKGNNRSVSSTNHGRVLHPRPAAPTSTPSSKSSFRDTSRKSRWSRTQTPSQTINENLNLSTQVPVTSV
ncbi:XK-related protein 6-like [Brevipalpus obovatus]|uniref:XK-related protein 6-like n=1 Tax=Brevipalpus obovatus TaxID=246614 RepID=UPI003D9F1C3A